MLCEGPAGLFDVSLVSGVMANGAVCGSHDGAQDWAIVWLGSGALLTRRCSGAWLGLDRWAATRAFLRATGKLAARLG